MVKIPYIKIPSVRVGSVVPTSNIGTGGATPAPPTPITYLTQWKIVGNSEVHGVGNLTSWKVSGNSVVDNNTILSCGDLGQDGKYHVKISNGATIFDIALDEPLRKVNNVADTIEFPSTTDGKAFVTRNVESKIVSAYTNKDGSQLTTTLPDNTILHIKQFVKNGDFSNGSTDWEIVNSSNTSCDFTQGKAIIQNIVQGHGYRYGIFQYTKSNIVIGNTYYWKYNAVPCKNIVLGADFSNRSNTRVSCVGNTDNIVSDVAIPASINQFYLGFSPTTDYEIGDTTEIDNVISFDLDVMFADCPSLKPTTASDFEAMFTNLSYIDYSSDAQEVIVNDGKLYKEDVIGIEILVPLATPTTELIDVSPFAVSPTDTYTSANVVPYSAFEHTENKEIWSCGEYNATDGKYHILVQPLGGSIADIALTEPLRKVNNVADSIEFPSGTEGKALVTRNLKTLSLKGKGWNKSNAPRYVLYIVGREFDFPERLRVQGYIMCSTYTETTFANTYNIDKSIGIVWNGSYNLISIRDTDVVTPATDITGEVILKLTTPTTELVDAPQIEEAESYSMVISQGAKAVSWSDFIYDSDYLLTDSENNILVDSEGYQLTIQS